MANQIQLKIVTPVRVAFEGTVPSVESPGWIGEFGVLARHAPMLTLVRPGIVTVHADGGERRMVVGAGFAEVGYEHMSLLVGVCEDVADVDKAKAEQDLSAAQAELEGTDPNSRSWDDVKRRVELAQARLEA